MSTSSQTPKMTTTTTMTAQIDRTKVDLTIPGQDQQKHKDLKEQSAVDVDAKTEAEKTASDRDYLEQIMGCGDVRRKIMRLESSGSTESLESMGKSSTVTPKYIGDNVPVVREVVQSMEDKICSTVVSAIPFAVQKRKTHEDDKEPNVVELEKQILTPADLALEKLIKCEPPSEVVKISPIEAMAVGLKEIEEEVCEKVCEKRKSFVVAEDFCETDKTLTEQVIDLNRQVDQVPARILTDTIEKHLDLEDRDVLEASPTVREVVQDIERKYPAASLEAKPFSPRKRVTTDRKVDVSSIEQLILSDADLILDGLGSKCIPEQKVQSPISSMNKTSSSTENLEDICEKICSKRTISDMAKVFERKEDPIPLPSITNVKSTTAKFLECESGKFAITESIQDFNAKSSLNEEVAGIEKVQHRFLADCYTQEFPIETIMDTKFVEFPKISHTLERLHSISKTDLADTKKIVHESSEFESKLDKLVHKIEQKDNQNPDFEHNVKFPTQDNLDEFQTQKNLTSEFVTVTDNSEYKFPTEGKSYLGKEPIESDSDEELDNLKKKSKINLLLKIEHSSYFDTTKIVKSTESREITKFPMANDSKSGDTFYSGEKAQYIHSTETMSDKRDKSFSHKTSLVTLDKSSADTSHISLEPESPEKKDEKVLAKSDDSSQSVIETVKPSPKAYSHDESDDEIDIPKLQDKPIGHPISLLTSVEIIGEKSPLHSKEITKSPQKNDEKVLAKPEDSFKSVIESDKPSLKEYSDDESDDDIDIPKPQDKPISQPTSLVTSVTGSEDKSPLHTEEKAKSPEKKDEKVLAKPDDSSKSVFATVKPSPNEYSDDESDDEIDIPKPQDKPISQPTSLVTSVTGSEDKSPLHTEGKPKSPEKKNIKPSQVEYSDNEGDAKIECPKPQEKPLSEPIPVVTPFSSFHDVMSKEVISFKAEESSTTIQSNVKFASTTITTEDTKIVIPIDSLSHLKDDNIPSSVDEKPKSARESGKTILKEHSDNGSEKEFGTTRPQDKSDSHQISLVTSVADIGGKSPLHTEEKAKSPEKKDEKVLAKPDDSSKSVFATVKPSPK
ncbi:uncharacterized protein Dyak_GE28429, partial [Drosophila yakuba]